MATDQVAAVETVVVPYEVNLESVGDGVHELQIMVNGQVASRHYDGGEPEDNLFVRDWAWVPTALEEAFKLGAEYGQGLIKQDSNSDQELEIAYALGQIAAFGFMNDVLGCILGRTDDGCKDAGQQGS